MKNIERFDHEASVPAIFEGGELDGQTTILCGDGLVIGPDSYYVATSKMKNGFRVFTPCCGARDTDSGCCPH